MNARQIRVALLDSRNNTESSSADSCQHFPRASRDRFLSACPRAQGGLCIVEDRWAIVIQIPEVNWGQTEQYVAFSRHYSRPLIASGAHRCRGWNNRLPPSAGCLSSLPPSLPLSSSPLSLHNARYPAGTMRDSAGYEAPHMLGAHLTRPTTPGSARPPRRLAPSRALPFPGGALSLAVAQDYRLRFARRMPRRVRDGSASGTPRNRRHRRALSRGWHATCKSPRPEDCQSGDDCGRSCFLFLPFRAIVRRSRGNAP